ncbi:MAG: TldD/PmbA family protein [Lachnospiraceae bacterium]
MEELKAVSHRLKRLIDEKNVKAQFTVLLTETREITMENGEFTLFRTLFDRYAGIKVIRDHKVGTTTVNQFDEESLKTALETALLSAQSGTADENFDIAPGIEPAEFHLGVEEPDIDVLMQRARELVDAIAKKHPKVLLMQVILKHVKKHAIYCNTNGSEDEKFEGHYELTLEFAGNDGTNSTGMIGTQTVFDHLDRPLLELDGVEKDLQDAENSLNPISLEGKFEGEVIFTPNCAAQMIYYALSAFISDSVILDNTGLWVGKLEEKVASEKLSIGMKPWDPRIIDHEVHTADGFRSEDYMVIEKGILKSYMASFYASNKCKVPRAGNSGFDLVVEAGETPYPDMVKNMKRGLIVGTVSCGRPSGNGELSGVAKKSFYVENGQIKGAVMETMINGNLAQMFQNVVAVSKEVLCDGTMVVPYIGVDHVVISGK